MIRCEGVKKRYKLSTMHKVLHLFNHGQPTLRGQPRSKIHDAANGSQGDATPERKKRRSFDLTPRAKSLNPIQSFVPLDARDAKDRTIRFHLL